MKQVAYKHLQRSQEKKNRVIRTLKKEIEAMKFNGPHAACMQTIQELEEQKEALCAALNDAALMFNDIAKNLDPDGDEHAWAIDGRDNAREALRLAGEDV